MRVISVVFCGVVVIGGRVWTAELSNLNQKGRGMEEWKEGGIMRLEEVEDGLPDLDGEHGGIEGIQGGSGGIFGGRDGGPSCARFLVAIPVPIAVVPVGQSGEISFAGATADTDGGCGIDAFSPGGLTGATGGVDAGIDAFDLAAPASRAGYTGSHGVWCVVCGVWCIGGVSVAREPSLRRQKEWREEEEKRRGEERRGGEGRGKARSVKRSAACDSCYIITRTPGRWRSTIYREVRGLNPRQYGILAEPDPLTCVLEFSCSF